MVTVGAKQGISDEKQPTPGFPENGHNARLHEITMYSKNCNSKASRNEVTATVFNHIRLEDTVIYPLKPLHPISGMSANVLVYMTRQWSP